jgi:hypothetical protein
MYAFLYADAFAMFNAIVPAGSDGAAADGIADGLVVACGAAVGVLVAVGDGATLPPDGASGVPPPPLQAASVNVSNNNTRFIAAQVLPESLVAPYAAGSRPTIL